MSKHASRHLSLSVTATALILLFSLSLLPKSEAQPGDRAAAGRQFETGIAEYRASLGYLAPLFSLPDTDGAVFNLEKLRGSRSVLLVFESTDCQYCRQESSALELVAAQYGDEVSVASINPEKRSVVEAYRQDNELNRTFLLDSDGQTSLAYRALSTPVHVFINKDGFITNTVIGYLEQDQLELYLKLAL